MLTVDSPGYTAFVCGISTEILLGEMYVETPTALSDHDVYDCHWNIKIVQSPAEDLSSNYLLVPVCLLNHTYLCYVKTLGEFLFG